MVVTPIRTTKEYRKCHNYLRQLPSEGRGVSKFRQDKGRVVKKVSIFWKCSGLLGHFSFLMFLIEEKGSYQELFTERKKFCSYPKLFQIQISKYIDYTMCANFNCGSPKITLKINLLLQFLRLRSRD